MILSTRSLSSGCVFTRAIKFSATMATVAVCAAVLAVSVVPLAELDTSGAYLRRVPAPLKRWYSAGQDAGIVSGYGLFRVMTGEGGRPELIVEGTNDPNNETWQQYHFKYKPGDVATAPRFNGECLGDFGIILKHLPKHLEALPRTKCPCGRGRLLQYL